MMEVMVIMVTSFKTSLHVLLHSVTPTLQQATTNHVSAGDSWTLTGKSGSVSCGVTVPVAYLTYMESTSCQILGWMNHKMESRFPGEVSTTSDMQMIPL